MEYYQSIFLTNVPLKGYTPYANSPYKPKANLSKRMIKLIFLKQNKITMPNKIGNPDIRISNMTKMTLAFVSNTRVVL
jgi:hypothetical protein